MGKSSQTLRNEDRGDDAQGGMRETLLRNSARLFAVNGYPSAKIADIVRASGVTQAAFYWHFASKLEVALEIIARGREQMLGVVRLGYRSGPTTLADMQANTERWLRQLLEFAERNRYFMAIVLSRLKGADTQVDEAIVATRTMLFNALRDNLAQAVAADMLPPTMELELRAALVYRLIEGSIEWWLFGPAYDLDHRPLWPAAYFARQLARFEFGGLLGASTGSGTA